MQRVVGVSAPAMCMMPPWSTLCDAGAFPPLFAGAVVAVAGAVDGAGVAGAGVDAAGVTGAGCFGSGAAVVAAGVAAFGASTGFAAGFAGAEAPVVGFAGTTEDVAVGSG